MHPARDVWLNITDLRQLGSDQSFLNETVQSIYDIFGVILNIFFVIKVDDDGLSINRIYKFD